MQETKNRVAGAFSHGVGNEYFCLRKSFLMRRKRTFVVEKVFCTSRGMVLCIVTRKPITPLSVEQTGNMTIHAACSPTRHCEGTARSNPGYAHALAMTEGLAAIVPRSGGMR
jgi:hypothetical protein